MNLLQSRRRQYARERGGGVVRIAEILSDNFQQLWGMTIENKTRHILVFECEIDNRCVLSVKIRSNELDISQKLNNSPYNTKINYSCKIPQSFLNCMKTFHAWKSEVWTMMLWYPQTHTHPLPLSRTVCREKNREKITFLMPNNYVTGACALKRKNRKRNEWEKNMIKPLENSW